MLQGRVHQRFSLQSCRTIIYRQWPTRHTLITHDERPKIIDTALTPILIMRQGACCHLFSLKRQLILSLCIVTTELLLNHLIYKTNIGWHSVDTLLTLILWMGQGACESLFCQWSQPIPHIRMTAPDHHTDYPWCKTNNCWHSVDTHFAIGISTICYHLIWHSILLLVFWQPLYHLHVLSPSSLHCSLIIHIDISCTLYIKVSANCR